MYLSRHGYTGRSCATITSLSGHEASRRAATARADALRTTYRLQQGKISPFGIKDGDSEAACTCQSARYPPWLKGRRPGCLSPADEALLSEGAAGPAAGLVFAGAAAGGRLAISIEVDDDPASLAGGVNPFPAALRKALLIVSVGLIIHHNALIKKILSWVIRP